MKRGLFVHCRIEDSCEDNDHDDEERTTEALGVVQEYTQLGDPMQSLQQHYQKQGYTESLATAWRQPQFYRIGRGKESSTYWRFTFQCPLDVSVSGSSGVPRSLLMMNESSTPSSNNNQQLADLWRQWFGEFIISPHDNLVYIGTKKNVKRSAALVVLWHLCGKTGLKEHILLTGAKQKPVKPVAPPRELSLHSLAKTIDKLSKISWVHDLHRCGIRRVQIDYHEHSEGKHPVILSPTYIICRMEINEPIQVQQASDPQPTKELARDQAVQRLVAAVTTTGNGVESEEVVSADRCVQSWIEKDELHKSDSPYLHMHVQVPEWARWKPTNGDKAILYRLSLVGCMDRFNLSADQLTPVGVILPYDPTFCAEEQVLPFQSKFSLDGSSSDELRVHLMNPVELEVERAELLDNFSTICLTWKQYGLNVPLQSIKTRMNPALRNYHFVPLLPSENSMVVDWNLMERVVRNETEPYLVVTRRVHLLHLLSAGVVYHLSSTIWSLDLPKALLFSFGFLILSLWCFFPRFTYQKKDDAFANHFLVHNKKKNCLFVSPSYHPLTRLMPPHVRSQETRDKTFATTNKAGIEPIKARFIDRFRVQSKTGLEHPTLHLLSAYLANKITDLNPLQNDELNLEGVRQLRLEPELVHILPMPRDFLFVVGTAERFMIPLETAITNCFKAHNVMKLTTSLGEKSPGSLSTFPQKIPGIDHMNLSRFAMWLSQATTVFPECRYERLEFLGDRVLNNMVSLCLFTRNGNLKWDADEFKDHYAAGKRNIALFDGALRAGLNRLLHAGTIRWKEEGASLLVADKHIRNMGESILGAIFVYGSVCDNTRNRMEMMMTGFMECLNLPLPIDHDNNDCAGNLWFGEGSLCHVDGFDFGGHRMWSLRLNEVRIALSSTGTIQQTLHDKCERLISIIVPTHSNELLLVRSQLLHGIPKLLLEIALFDATLDGSDVSIQDPEDQARLWVAGMIRDNIFHVGSTALELVLSRDLFLLNPSATPGDLHLLLTCAQTHDVLSYIVLKNQLHTCLFDEHLPHQRKILQMAVAADAIGGERWDSNGGWILPGGVSTFQSRLKKLRSLVSTSNDPEFTHLPELPRYPGLAGGRLYGSDKKLNLTEIADWQFSFKCIFGALVLSLGAERSWNQILRPLLEEVMLLNADEYREHYAEASAICKNYSRGNTNCLSDN